MMQEVAEKELRLSCCFVLQKNAPEHRQKGKPFVGGQSILERKRLDTNRLRGK